MATEPIEQNRPVDGELGEPQAELPDAPQPTNPKRSRSAKPKRGAGNRGNSGEWDKYPRSATGRSAAGPDSPPSATDPTGEEGGENPEIVVEVPEADAPPEGAGLFGFSGILDGLMSRMTATPTSPAKSKQATDDAEFYLFIAESVVVSRTYELGVVPSQQEHKLMVAGLADLIKYDSRLTKAAKAMRWIALPVGAGLWGLRLFTAYMQQRQFRQEQARIAQERAAMAPDYIPTPPAAAGSADAVNLDQLFSIQPGEHNGLEPTYGADPSIFGR